MTNQPKEDRLFVPAGEIRVHRCYNPEHIGAYMLACPDCIAEWVSGPTVSASIGGYQPQGPVSKNPQPPHLGSSAVMPSSASAPQRPPAVECGICNDTKRVEYPDWADDAGQWTILNGPCPECYNFDASTAPSQLRMENAALRQQVETLTAERDKCRNQLYVEDGFGSTWGPCPECGSRMQVVRPGSATCGHCEIDRVCDQLIEEKRGWNKEMKQAIAQAVADERERCARLVENFPTQGSGWMELLKKRQELAAAIRAQGNLTKGDIK